MYKDFVLEDLEQAGVSTNAIIDSTRPTVNKNAFVVGGYRLLVDTIDNRSISEQILTEMTDAVSEIKQTLSCIQISDMEFSTDAQFQLSSMPCLRMCIKSRIAKWQVVGAT